MSTSVSTAESPQDLTAFLEDLAAWAENERVPFETVRYGVDAEQQLDLRLPDASPPHPLGVILHGGFWRAPFTRRNTSAVAVALTKAGWATANVEYRRHGPGTYRTTLDDVADARRRLAELRAPLDLDAMVAIGHSAGGQLALWLAARKGAVAAVALGGVCDLEAAARAGLGGNAVQEFLGGEPDVAGHAYDEADPRRLLPLGVPQLLVHGTEDDRVPITLAREYARRAHAAGDDCRLVELDGADHFDVIDPRSPSWGPVSDAVSQLVSRPVVEQHRPL